VVIGALPGGLACHLPRDPFAAARSRSLHILEAEDPVGELGHRFQVPVQYGGVQEDGRLPRGLLHGLGNVARHIPGPFLRPMLHYPERAVVLLQDGPELDGGEGPSHYQLHGAAVQPAEDARANAGDKEDPELLEVGVAVQGPGQHLLGGDRDAQRLGEQGDGGQEFDFHE